MTILGNSLPGNYRFDNFVFSTELSPISEYASTTANYRKVTHNPLYVYGAIGFGKTHFISAIANQIHQQNPFANICYWRAERFDELSIEELAIAYDCLSVVDVLLFDDIHLLSHVESKKGFISFVETFIQKNKQIIVSADRLPRALMGWEKSSLDLFEAGQTLKIEPPDFEVRRKILQLKASQMDIALTDEVETLLAGLETCNIREMEGFLVRANAYALLTDKPLTATDLTRLLN